MVKEKGEKKLNGRRHSPCGEDYIVIAPGKRFEDARRATKEAMANFEDARRATEAIARYPADCVPHAVILGDSSHRDGSTYNKATSGWPIHNIHYCIANRDESKWSKPLLLFLSILFLGHLSSYGVGQLLYCLLKSRTY